MIFADVNFNLYKTFISVYETGSFSKSAEKLFLTQPAIRHGIKELEAQLNKQLFVTHTRGVEPTNAAKELYTYLFPIISSLNLAGDVVVKKAACAAFG